LDPIVYRDLVRKVVFLGAPCTGKSTIAQLCAERLGTVFMPEYGREYWEKYANNRRLTMGQLEEIAVTHRSREDDMALQALSTLFVDTDASTTAVFADYYHQQRSDLLESMAKDGAGRYDVTFLCENDFPYADTPDRSGEANQIELQRRIREDLRRYKRPFIPLSGTIEERIAAVIEFLGRSSKYDNPGEWKLDV
jgi:NadR type nicotinamide-nucleotide adenylyltransferase